MRYQVIRKFQDRGLSWLLASRQHLNALLQLLLPEVAAAADRRAWSQEPPGLLRELGLVEEDVIWTGRLRRGPPFRVVVAHQSSPDRLISYRLDQTLGRLDARDMREQEDADTPSGKRWLVHVIPILVHTGPRPWIPPGLRELYRPHEALLRWRRDLAPELLDLATRSEAELTSVNLPLGWLLSLWRAQHAHRAEFADTLDRVLAGLRRCAGNESQFLQAAWFCYQLVANRRPRKEHAMLRRVIERHVERSEVKIMAETQVEAWEKAGEARGRAEKGRESLSLVIRSRFGRLPRKVSACLASLGEAELDELLRLAATAESLADLSAAVEDRTRRQRRRRRNGK